MRFANSFVFPDRKPLQLSCGTHFVISSGSNHHDMLIPADDYALAATVVHYEKPEGHAAHRISTT